jgi:uncharacterized membrane protein YhaH (DUF805 family)
VNFLSWISTPRSKNDRKSWHPLWSAVLVLLFVIFILAFQVAQENKAASLQETSFGIISDCDHSARGGYHCHYTFRVGEKQYAGVSSSTDYLYYGTTTVIYYDSQNPDMNSLEDFSIKSRKDRRAIYIFMLIVVTCFAIILYSKSTYREE